MTSLMLDQFNHALFRAILMATIGTVMVLTAGCANTPAQGRAPAAESKTAQASRSATLAHSFEDAVTRGDAAWNSGQADMAIYFYVQALSFRPRDVATLGKLGSIEQAQGDLALAARAFELAATADPSDARLTGRLGLILMTLGDQEKASKWLRLSVTRGNTDWRVVDQLSVIENQAGHYTSALRYSEDALARAPAGAALPRLHRAQAFHGMGNYTEAEQMAREALHLGDAPDAWRLLGQIQATRRAYSAAVDCFLQVMDPATAYNMVGKLALDNADNGDALHYFEKASAASPVYLAEARRNAAIAHERLSAGRKQ